MALLISEKMNKLRYAFVLGTSLLATHAVAQESATGERAGLSRLARRIVEQRLFLAESLAEARVLGLTCDLGIYVEGLLGEVRQIRNISQAVGEEYSQYTSGRIKGSKFLHYELSPFLDYHAAIGDLTRDDEWVNVAQALAQGVIFEPHDGGAMGPSRRLKFLRDGVVELTTLKLLDAEPYYERTTVKGTWQYSPINDTKAIGKVRVDIGRASHDYLLRQENEGDLREWPVFVLDDLGTGASLYNEISECDA